MNCSARQNTDGLDVINPSHSVLPLLSCVLLTICLVTYLTLSLATTRIEEKWLLSQKPEAPRSATIFGDDAVVTLERSSCFGPCPIYTVSIYGSGRVQFTGIGYVCRKNPFPTLVDRNLVAQLMNGMINAKFESIPSYSDAVFATDASDATITLAHDGHRHLVVRNHADGSAPRLLGMIEQRIDDVAGISTWIGKQTDSGRVCLASDGTMVPVKFDLPNEKP